MSTEVFPSLTGSGFVDFTLSGNTDVVRIYVTNTGVAGPLFPFGTPQRYGGIGWIAPVDFVPAGFDSVFPADTKFMINPVIWIDTLQLEIDLAPLNTDLFGVSGMAYSLNQGVSIDIYHTEF